MRISRIFTSTLFATVFSAGVAAAHPQTTFDVVVPENEAGAQGGIYVWNYLGLTSVWQEDNGKTTDGMYADSSGTRVLGLQLHDVCYGTFSTSDPAKGPVCLNLHHGNMLFTYLPWGYFQAGKWVDGAAEDCEAAGGEYRSKDTRLHGQYDLALDHVGQLAVQCFPTGYGRPGYCPDDSCGEEW